MEGVSRFVWVEDILKMDSFKSVIDWLDLDITIDTAELAAFETPDRGGRRQIQLCLSYNDGLQPVHKGSV